MQELEAIVRDDQKLDRMSAEELDAMPFGMVRLDRRNRVTRYNATEARLSCRDPAKTIGRHYFEEVAPCTNTLAFRGRLEQMLSAGVRSARFDYRFLFPWGIRNVQIRIRITDEARWIFVLPR